MKISLSVAISADNYMDDMSAERLVLSTVSDWAAVYRLRSEHDAILVGGETLRRDDPSLGLKGEAAQAALEGRGGEPLRVVVSGRSEISPSAKIFHRGSAPILIFSNIEREELRGLADVVVAPVVDVALIVTELERRGLSSLFVEGGATILKMFLGSGFVSSLRVAQNPTIFVGDESAPRFELPETIGGECDVIFEQFDEMEVATYLIGDEAAASDEDREVMRQVVDYSLQSPPKQSCYRVGAAVVTAKGERFFGYTLETSPTHHAEQAAITKALAAGANLQGATIYASMEPCSQRSSEPESCSALILRYGFRRVVFALYEPSHFVQCHGAENLRRRGVEVLYLAEFSAEVLSINQHIFS